MATPEPTRPVADRPVRIANCSGFLGDRLAAAREQVEGGPIDVLTGDWLAELTMLILARQRLKHGPGTGFARPFLTQMEEVLAPCLERGIRVVSNAGGLDPQGCAEALREVAGRLGLAPRVAVITGDDLSHRRDELAAAVNLDTGERLCDVGLHPLTANAYLGGFGVAAALAAGADVVITGRTTDAALVSGPAAWWHGWGPADLDALAGATAAGHVIECGAQATGGNYAFFEEVVDPIRPGFPIAEIAADGAAVITKHSGTGGQVSVGTVTAQLLYEIAGPAYAGPDVTARFDTVSLEQVGPDRVALRGTQGEPAPPTLKVSLNALGGFRNAMSLVLTGPDRDAKAALVLQQLEPVLSRIAQVTVHRVPAGDEREELRVVVRDPDRDLVSRPFTQGVVEIALASYPGLYPTAPPAQATPYGVYWPTSVDTAGVEQVVTLDGTTLVRLPGGGSGEAQVGAPKRASPARPAADPAAPGRSRTGGSGPAATTKAPLGRLVGARSGDKGGNANVGLWVRDPQAYGWLTELVTPETVRSWIPEAQGCSVDVFALPNLLAVNVVVIGLLGRGVAENASLDPQAKGLGELVRARVVDVPTHLLPEAVLDRRPSDPA